MQDDILFVPGRLSLIGGISDLVSSYLSQNKDLVPGAAIAVTLDKGIYSHASENDKFIYKYDDIYYECERQEETLKEQINSNNFLSYICGTLLYMKRKYGEQIGGLELEIIEMDLPIKKGLSSSAAICITIAKHMNRLYNLNLSNDDIVNIAYNGEHLAGSKCGMLDQNSIMNPGLSHLTFFEERTEVIPLDIGADIDILIVDLNSKKNTRKIMDFYNNAMSFPQELDNKKVYDFFKNDNHKLVKYAMNSIKRGDLRGLGKSFNKFQECIDVFGNYCDELKAPVLHSILCDEYIKENTHGGKGTGSGGDGSAMLVCKDSNSSSSLNKYIKEKYNMDTTEVHIKKKVKCLECIK